MESTIASCPKEEVVVKLGLVVASVDWFRLKWMRVIDCITATQTIEQGLFACLGPNPQGTFVQVFGQVDSPVPPDRRRNEGCTCTPSHSRAPSSALWGHFSGELELAVLPHLAR